MIIAPIAHIHTDFPTKFGIPRQSGLVEELCAEVIFDGEYRNPDAIRGIEGFSHIWLIWEFSGARREGWSATVRPPRLGGNTRMGVFATRSPFRPNPLGLSCVRLAGVDYDVPYGPLLRVAGADLMDGTPIYDIKPYLPHADMRPDATGGFAADLTGYALKVVFPDELLALIPPDKRDALKSVLAQDPRPSYQDNPDRIYGFGFCGMDVRFCVADGVLSVCEVVPQP